MQSMTQSEKVMLRYQYVLSSLGFVFGDFAFTADTFANRWRVLQQQMIQFGSTVGTIFINAFKPVLRVLNTVMNAAIQFAETVLNALGAIFGWTYEISAAGISDDLGLSEAASDMGDIASGAGDTASGLGNAAKNAAKLKTQLQSFDRLNNLSSPNESGSGGSGGSGGGGGGGGGGTSGGSGAISIARHTGEGLIKAYESTINSLHGLGEYISTSLRDALRNIDWDSIYAEARSFGTGLASFLNGLIRPDTFYEVGKTIANSLNTAMEFFFGLGDVFSFKNLGVSIRNALTGFFDNFNWDLAKANIGVWLDGLAETINNLITPDLFKDIGTFLSQAVNTAFHGVHKFFIRLDGANIGISLAEGANSFIEGLDADEIAGAINEAIRDVKDAVVNFATHLGWEEAWAKAQEVLGKLDIPIVELIIGAFAITTAAKIALAAGKLLLAKKAIEWLGIGGAASAAAAESSAAAGTAAAVAGPSGLITVALPLAVTAIAAGALEFKFPDKSTAGEAVWTELKSALRYDPSDPGNAPWNIPVEISPEIDKDIWDKTLPEIVGDLTSGIQSKFDEFMKAHPLLAKVIGYKFEDQIPQEGKKVNGMTGEVTGTDQKKMPLEAKLVRDGKIAINDLDQGGLTSGKKKVTGGQMGVSSVYDQLSAAAKKKGWGLSASVASLWAASNMKKSYDWKLKSSVKNVYKATSGFTGFTLSGTIKGGGGKVTAVMRKNGGVFDNGKWSDIPRFADGGVPSVAYGSLFWAGEAGPELVGHVGGRTEVLNASQIAVAVSDGVARANNSVVNALAAQNRILVGILEKKTGISSRDIFAAVRSEASNYQNRTGMPAFG